MTSYPLQDIIEYYSKRLDEYGVTKEALVYKNSEHQEKKYALMCEVELIDPNSSILDAGCGLGFFYDYLRKHGWKGEYTGIDITPSMVEAARRRIPEGNFICSDFRNCQFNRNYDYVFCCATIQHRPKSVEPVKYVKEVVGKMFTLANKAAIFDVFTSRVDYMEKHNLYVVPEELLSLCYAITPRLVLRNDSRPYEIMMYLYKNTVKNALNIFQDWKGFGPKITSDELR